MTEHEHHWLGRESIVAVTGFDRFHARIRRLTGVTLPHPGYVVLECSSCGEWGLRDYCGGDTHVITPDAARELMGSA